MNKFFTRLLISPCFSGTFVLAFLVMGFSRPTLAQVGIGTTTPKAALQITSPNSGVLIPRYATLAAANATSLPTLNPTDHRGLMIYVDEAANQGFWFYDGTAFVKVGATTGVLPITNGGTGATTAGAALNALLPTQTSNASKVLTTDGTNASWQKPTSRTRSIILDLGSIDVSTGQNYNPPTKATLSGNTAPAVVFAKGATQAIHTQIPIPADWNGTSAITATLYYCSGTTSGNFYVRVFVKDISLNTDVTALPYGCSDSNYPASTTANGLMSKIVTLNCSVPFPASTKIISLWIDRLGGSSGDTATGSFNLLGIRIDYQD